MTHLDRLRVVIADDGYAGTFQSLSQYRGALLQHIRNISNPAAAANITNMEKPMSNNPTTQLVPPAAPALPCFDDISIDIETLSTRQDAAVVSIGAVKFDRATGALGQALYVEIDLDSAIQAGHVSGSTLTWWMTQAVEARAAFGSRGAPKPALTEALFELTKFVGSGARVWGNGSIFDITILDNAYRACGLGQPWDFWNVRDMRTLVDAAKACGFDKASIQRLGTPHHALDDAQYQAEVISACWKLLCVRPTIA